MDGDVYKRQTPGYPTECALVQISGSEATFHDPHLKPPYSQRMVLSARSDHVLLFLNTFVYDYRTSVTADKILICLLYTSRCV